MTIHLSKDLERFVHQAVQTGVYASEDDVVHDALNRLKQAMPEQSATSGRGTKPAGPGPAQRKEPLTREEFDSHLLAIGLLSRLPDTAADFDDPDDEPIEIKGEPLSETIIRERR
jgi:Arc/MetJ-type ribon-helix-helix transcriptional regulator